MLVQLPIHTLLQPHVYTRHLRRDSDIINVLLARPSRSTETQLRVTKSHRLLSIRDIALIGSRWCEFVWVQDVVFFRPRARICPTFAATDGSRVLHVIEVEVGAYYCGVGLPWYQGERDVVCILVLDDVGWVVAEEGGRGC
jgi:hypothetical protein